MAAAIKAETNGRFDLQIFPNNQLGSDTDMLSQLRSGGVEFFTLSGLILSTLVPAASINGIGFAFPDYEMSGRRWTASSAPTSAAQIARPTSSRWIRSGTTASARSPRRRKPINTPDDLKGFKIRVPVCPLWTSMFKALECLARLDQLQRGLLGAADQDRRRPGEPAGDHLDREVLRSAEILLADQPHVGWLLVPGEPPRLGETAAGPARIVAKHINAAAMKERADVAKLNAGLREELAAKVSCSTSRTRRHSATSCARPSFYSEWKGKYGDQAWELLERAAGKLS